MNTTIDQRSYFRVDDQLKLSWHPVAPTDLQSDAQANSELLDINEQLSKLISLAFQESAPIGEALGLLNRKLDILTASQQDNVVPMQLVRVNISGAGVGFSWHEPATVGEEIDVTLMLKPSNVCVSLRAEVIGCEESRRDGEAFWIRSAFEDEQDIAIEQIIQHVSHRQTEILAAKHRLGELSQALKDDVDD